jgi:hypothetical protein
MKLFNSRKALVLGGLLIVTLAAGCTAGPGYSNNPYGYNSGYATSPYNSGYASSYPYNSGYANSYSGYGSSYPYNGGYQYPQNQQSYNQQYWQNRQTFNQQYQKNLQTYNQQHPNAPYYQHPKSPYHPQHRDNQQHEEHQ